MSNTLEIFIQEHRNELDVYTPSVAVWNGIEAGMQHPTFIKSKASWLKYLGFSASVIAVLVYLKINTSSDNTALNQPAEVKAQTTAQTVVPEIAPQTSEVKGPSTQTLAVQFAEANKNAEQATAKEQINSIPPSSSHKDYILGEANGVHFAPSAPFYNNNSSGIWAGSKDSLRIDTAFAGIKMLEVNCSNFDVNVSSVAGDKVSFRAKSKTEKYGLSFGNRIRTVKYEQKDSILIITEEKGSSNTVTTVGLIKESSAMNFEVPSSISVVINSSYGDVKVSGLQGKECTIHSNSGDVKLEKLSTEVMLHLGYGDLAAENITGNVSGTISSGDVSFTDLKGNVDIETSYGDQHYKSVTGNIKAHCSSGDLKITGMKGDANISSNYGDISLEDFKGSPMLQTSSGDIKGKNVELTEKMEANTSYGDIKMKFSNELSALSFDAETSYGTINLDKGGEKISEDKHLVLNKGSILVKAHTSSGDQSYK